MLSFSEKIAALRAYLKNAKLDGFIVPRSDEYMGEYVPACAERLKWLTGFSGSAGFAIILANKAAVFSDGRYVLQLRQQVDNALYAVEDSTKITAGAWLSKHARKEAIIGFDPKLHTLRDIAAIREMHPSLIPIAENPIDRLWANRPPAPHSMVRCFPLTYAGIGVADKIDQVAQAIKNAGAQAALITLPDSVAWMLNIRADDIPHTPVALSVALVHADGRVDWFIDPARVPPDVLDGFSDRVRLVSQMALPVCLSALHGKPVMMDGRKSAIAFADMIKAAGAVLMDTKDPIIPLKARKNPSEQAAMRAAHRRDGLAVTEFLAWLDREALHQPLDELGVERMLESYRQRAPQYLDSSFDTIAGFGANAAIIHYRATPETNKTIIAGGFLLLDSGAQYEDGTTDITRTIAIGPVSADMKTHFTLVLKGHIALSIAKFPAGTTGAQLDAYARAPLWQRGLDYAHGTGHGVGCYLSVHEESANLSPRGLDALEEGMILSNEPGYYREGQYGIRIENLLLVQRDGVCVDTGKVMFSFETLTLAPIDPDAIDINLLTAEEKQWLIAYHKRVMDLLGRDLSSDARDFLERIVARYKKEMA